MNNLFYPIVAFVAGADHYFQIVTWKGREKAARYAHRRRKRRGKGVFSGRVKVTAPQLAVNG